MEPRRHHRRITRRCTGSRPRRVYRDSNVVGAAMLVAIAVLAACSARHEASNLARQREIQQATQHYSDLIVAMDHAAIAAMYTDDGEMAAEGQPTIRGPEAIKAHLETFKDFHVLSESLTADSITVSGSTAHVVGTYHQRVRIPAGDTVEVSGGYVADWLLDATGQWRVRRMATHSTH